MPTRACLLQETCMTQWLLLYRIIVLCITIIINVMLSRIPSATDYWRTLPFPYCVLPGPLIVHYVDPNGNSTHNASHHEHRPHGDRFQFPQFTFPLSNSSGNATGSFRIYFLNLLQIFWEILQDNATTMLEARTGGVSSDLHNICYIVYCMYTAILQKLKTNCLTDEI